jgi:hypothetical protein
MKRRHLSDRSSYKGDIEHWRLVIDKAGIGTP